MPELHVVALSEDGRHVVLATRPGTAAGEFRVALDERLAAAVRGELPAPGRDAPPSISPRDIQARLREGEAPDEIAASAGVPLSRVERYAGPVLAELDRMITGARAAVVTRPRLGPSALPLGEAVQAHLSEVANLTEGSVRWSARRTEQGRWVVEVSWTARGRRRTAGWHYDPASREVTAVDGPSAVLGHVEAEAAAVPAGSRTARPAAPAAATRGARAGAGTRAATAAPTARATPAPAAPAPRTAAAAAARPAGRPPAATAAATAAAASSRAGAAAGSSAPGSRRRAPAPPAAAAPAPAPRRRTAAPPADEPAATAPAAGASTRRAPAAGRTTPAASRVEPRRTSRRSAVPALDGLAAAAPDTTGRASSRRAPEPPAPAGPPVLRVVPPAEPEPTPAEGAADEGAAVEAPPARRAAGQRAGGRDWADVLMGGAPAARSQSEQPRREQPRQE